MLFVFGGEDAAKASGFRGAEQVGDWVFYLWYAAWALYFGRRHGLSMRDIAAPPPRPDAWAWTLLAVPLVAVSASMLYLQITALSLWSPQLAQQLLESETTGEASRLLAVAEAVTGSTLVPLAEEIVFRGVLLQLWVRRYGLRTAVVGTSLLFTLLHPVDPLGTFLFGVAMAWLFLSSRSVWLPAATHALYNSIVEVLVYLEDSREVTTVAQMQADWLQPMLVLMAALILLAAVFRHAMQHNGDLVLWRGLPTERGS